MKKIISLWGPVLLFAALVFIVSSMPIPLKEAPFPNFDKVAHMSEYALFAMLLYRALSGTLNRAQFMWLAILTIVISLFYGMSDELHQAFVPSRTADIKDAVADGMGATVAMTLVFIKKRFFRRAAG